MLVYIYIYCFTFIADTQRVQAEGMLIFKALAGKTSLTPPLFIEVPVPSL